MTTIKETFSQTVLPKEAALQNQLKETELENFDSCMMCTQFNTTGVVAIIKRTYSTAKKGYELVVLTTA